MEKIHSSKGDMKARIDKVLKEVAKTTSEKKVVASIKELMKLKKEDRKKLKKLIVKNKLWSEAAKNIYPYLLDGKSKKITEELRKYKEELYPSTIKAGKGVEDKEELE